MRSKQFATAAWQFLFMALTCCNSFAEDPSTNAIEPSVQSTTSVTVTNPAINQTLSFELKPTAIAPAGASGSAQLKAGAISVHLSALGPGVYELEAMRRSDGLRQTLGAITIVDPTSSPSRQATDNKKEASANPESVQVVTDASLSIPKGLKVQDVSRILLMNRGNAVLDSQVK